MNESVLVRFPKTRDDLPEDFQKVYDKFYQDNRAGNTPSSSVSRRLEQWMHRKVALGGKEGERILEIGAGSFNHLPYEKPTQAYDAIEPWDGLAKVGTNQSKVRKIYKDMNELPKDAQYDRIVSVASLEHILDLPRVVAQSALLLDSKGVFRAGIPSEGTPLWDWGWRLTTGREFQRRYKLDFEVFARYEHVNDCFEIADVLRVFFGRVKIRCFGLARWISLYQVISCSEPRKDRAQAYLANSI